MTPAPAGGRGDARLSDAERRFAGRAVRRRPLFLALSAAGVVVAAGLAGATVWRWRDPAFSGAAHVVVVILILLNARGNLRQARYAAVLDKLLRAETSRERA